MKKDFGYCPVPLWPDAMPVWVRELRNFQSIVDSVSECGVIEDG